MKYSISPNRRRSAGTPVPDGFYEAERIQQYCEETLGVNLEWQD